MPLYDFLNKETGESEEHMVKLADYDQFIKDNPHLQREFTTASASIVSHAGGNIVSKTSSDWRDHLKKIKKNAGKKANIKTY
tara:strand:+ start:1134 stop:1379 length:246 start_codon:yes stop_codon:yes gene_type:complete